MVKFLLKNICLHFRKKQLAKIGCRFEKNVYFDQECKFEGANLISYGTYLKNVDIGKYSYTGYGCYLTGVKIGRYTSVGPCVKTAIGKHPVNTFVSTHPQFFTSTPPSKRPYINKTVYKEVAFACNDKNGSYPICIGNDVWIGADVVILDGVTVGDGAIIAAGAVVTKDVAPYAVVAGVPAKVIKYRFKSIEIDFLKQCNWWDYSEEWLKKHADKFIDIDAFRQAMKDR